MTGAATASERDWSLFVDWCEAFEMNPWDAGPEEVLAYAADLPAARGTLARRLRAVAVRVGWRQLGLEALERAGAGDQSVAPAWREREGYEVGADPLWLPLERALSRCPFGGWPDAYRGRRDAWMLVLLAPPGQGGVGLSRRDALAVCGEGPRGVVLSPSAGETEARVSVTGVEVTSTEATGGAAAGCPACAVVRWCEVLGHGEKWPRSGPREVVAAVRDMDPSHVCGTELVGIARRWPRVLTMAPGIDQHGWNLLPMTTDAEGVYERFSMSPRSVTEMLTRRCSRLVADRLVPEDEMGAAEPNPWDLDEPVPRHGRRGPYAELALNELFDLLDETADDSDEVNSRISALLDETDEMVAGLGKAARG